MNQRGTPMGSDEFRKTIAGCVRLGDLREGAIFETAKGARAVKSEYYYGNEPGSQCLCILLESGEFAHFPNKNDELVREVKL